MQPWPTQAPVTWATPARDAYELPSEPRSVLVIADRIAGYEGYARTYPRIVTLLLSHFSARTTWKFADKVTSGDVAGADVVVYLGDNATEPTPLSALTALRSARRIVLIQYHLVDLRDAGIAFKDVAGSGSYETLPSHTMLEYHRRVGQYAADDFTRIAALPEAVTAELRLPHERVPFVVRDGNATFINGPINFDDEFDDVHYFGAAVVADALWDALGSRQVVQQHEAMLRLEDVSVQTPPARLRAIVSMLYRAGVPYGIGLIPDQWIKGTNLKKLAEEPDLVETLRWAESHGATIVVHGLHHSYNSAEDFEFWDGDHDRPLAYDSATWMRGRITEAIADEVALGLHPRMWETPHYSASPTDYGEVARKFLVAWEQRRPLGWFPWVLQRDEYGQVLLPEDLGYVSFDRRLNVAQQLKRARTLLVCRGCIAAGFLHPSTVTDSDVLAYVTGLRALGYVFVDPGGFVTAAELSKSRNLQVNVSQTMLPQTSR